MNQRTIRRILRAICFELAFVLLLSAAGAFVFKVIKEQQSGEKKESQQELTEESTEDEEAPDQEDYEYDDASLCKGIIGGYSADGALITDISPDQLKVYGIDQNDLVQVRIGKRVYILPVEIDESLEVIWGRTRLALDPSSNKMMIIRDYQDFSMMEGYTDRNIGDEIGVSLLQSDGYKMEWQEPLGLTDTVANFRVVETGDLGKGVLYRGHSPIDPKYSDIRCRCSDDLAWEHMINTMLNLNQTVSEVESDVYRKCPESYYRYLYDQGSVFCVKLDGKASYTQEFREGIAGELRFIINNPAPYMVHCRNGKDRAGFVVALLQALEGTTLKDIGEEYAKSFRNYCGVEKGSWMDQYNQTDGAYTFLEMMQQGDVGRFTEDDGSQTQIAARSYMEQIGLSDEEIDLLQDKLASNISN